MLDAVDFVQQQVGEKAQRRAAGFDRARRRLAEANRKAISPKITAAGKLWNMPRWTVHRLQTTETRNGSADRRPPGQIVSWCDMPQCWKRYKRHQSGKGHALSQRRAESLSMSGDVPETLTGHRPGHTPGHGTPSYADAQQTANGDVSFESGHGERDWGPGMGIGDEVVVTLGGEARAVGDRPKLFSVYRVPSVFPIPNTQSLIPSLFPCPCPIAL